MTGKALNGTKGSPLRQRMIDQMRIANLAESTRYAYTLEVEHLAKHYKASPADLDAEQVRAWVLTVIDKGLSPSLTSWPPVVSGVPVLMLKYDRQSVHQ